jgi:hypothetical protein
MSVEDRVSARNARKTSAFRFASDMKVQPLACPSELAACFWGFYLGKILCCFYSPSLFSYFFNLKNNFSFSGELLGAGLYPTFGFSLS